MSVEVIMYGCQERQESLEDREVRRSLKLDPRNRDHSIAQFILQTAQLAKDLSIAVRLREQYGISDFLIDALRNRIEECYHHHFGAKIGDHCALPDDWEQRFDSEFCQSTDNGSGPLWMFATSGTHPDTGEDMLTIARPEHFKNFIRSLFEEKPCRAAEGLDQPQTLPMFPSAPSAAHEKSSD